MSTPAQERARRFLCRVRSLLGLTNITKLVMTQSTIFCILCSDFERREQVRFKIWNGFI